jgi:hypothetical protein
MIAQESRQVTNVRLNEDTPTFFIAACGYEGRGPHAAKALLRDGGAVKKLAFGFAEHKVPSRIAVDEEFRRLGFDIVDDVPSGSGVRLATAVRDIVKKASGAVKLVIDYSCMTKMWYAAIIRELFDTRRENISVEVYFVYSPARFASPGPPGVNKVAGAISGFGHLRSPLLPTALLLGLGYEPVRAMGLRDYVDPELTMAFYTDPALDERYQAAVMRSNTGLLTTLPTKFRFRYGVADLDYTNALLRNVALGLIRQYRVIIAPLGPKPFCLLSLILSAECSAIDVWRVSVGEEITPQERDAAGPLLILRVLFVPARQAG